MVIRDNGWHTGTGIQRTGRKSHCLEERRERGDGGAGGRSAVGDGGRAVVLLVPGAMARLFPSLKVHNLKACV